MGHSRPLGRVHGVERHGLFLGIGTALDCLGFLGPGGCHRFRERAQATHGVVPAEAEIQVDVGQRPLRLAAVALEQNGPNAQYVDGLSEQIVRRCGVGPATQRLKLFDYIACMVVAGCLSAKPGYPVAAGRCPCPQGAATPRRCRAILPQSADQGSAQERSEGERIAIIGKNARQRDEILNFLAPEEALAGLGGDRDAAALQGFLVAPEVRAGRPPEGRCRRAGRCAARPSSGPEWCRCRSAGRTSRQRVRPPWPVAGSQRPCPPHQRQECPVPRRMAHRCRRYRTGRER